MSEDREITIKRLLYQSWYRGCKETDRIVGYFCKDYIHEMSDMELGELQEIMHQDDADIYAWVNGSRQVPDNLRNNSILQRILSYDIAKALQK